MATSVQFSIRSLLIAMVLTAVGLAAAMPVIRTWGTAAQVYFVINAAFLMGLTGLVTVHRCVIRRRTERSAGEIVLRAVTQGNRFVRLFYLFLLVLFVIVFFLVIASEAQSASAGRSLSAYRPRLGLIYLGWMAACLVTHCWWGTGPGIVELAEHGVILRAVQFLPYSHFQTARWNHYFPDILVLAGSDCQLTQIIVPRAERKRVHQFLKRKGLLSSQPELSQEAVASPGGQPAGSPKITPPPPSPPPRTTPP